MIINKSIDVHCQLLLYDLFTVIAPSYLLGFGTRPFHSGQTLFDGFQPAPKIRRLGLEARPGGLRLSRFNSPARSVAGGVRPAAEETGASSEAALKAAAAGPEASAVRHGSGICVLSLISAIPKPAAGPRALPPWPCSIVSWHDDTSYCDLDLPGDWAACSACGLDTGSTPETVSLSSDAPDSSGEFDNSRCAGVIPPSLPLRQRLRPRPQGGASPAN